MDDLLSVFRAGRSRRWHTHARLASTDDRIDGHSGRVARIILALHPCPSLRLITTALIHDDGEHAVGDMAGPVKSDLMPDLRDALEQAEFDAILGIWGGNPNPPSTEEKIWLKFADRLDAVMWCAWHAPRQLERDDWRAAIVQLVKIGKCIGVPELLVAKLLEDLSNATS